jgi:hypothetical protein
MRRWALEWRRVSNSTLKTLALKLAKQFRDNVCPA